MRILVVTDAWFPQINGVVRTLETLTRALGCLGHEVEVLAPDRFRTVPCPSYPEIRLAVARPAAIAGFIEAVHPAAIHIVTEGPLGLLARRYCLKFGFPFTTSLHTRFPEYAAVRWRLPLGLGYRYLRWFHRPAKRTMVATRSLETELAGRGFAGLVRWGRGVDTQLFRTRPGEIPALLTRLPRPISLYVGRIAVEKNIEDFLRLDLPGTKIVIGDGPQRRQLEARYPGVRFLGLKTGEDLAQHYAAADVFVFPSRTDTFGLVLLEALASGMPVAAYPVPGPVDVIGSSGAGCLHEDLRTAAETALTIPSSICRAHALKFSWTQSAEQFAGYLQVFR